MTSHAAEGRARPYMIRGMLGMPSPGERHADGRVVERRRTEGQVERDLWSERARARYEQAVFGGDTDALEVAEQELKTVEAALALAQGRLAHARFLAGALADQREEALFERAADLYRQLEDVRGQAESLFWIGAFHQVVGGDHDTAVPLFERSYALAEQAADKATMSYAARHLGIAEHAAGRTGPARARLEESVRLRREIGFLAGVAANLVGLAHLAVDEGRRDDASALADEAASIAEDSGAHGILAQVAGVRARL
jgi:hypothetical protein